MRRVIRCHPSTRKRLPSIGLDQHHLARRQNGGTVRRARPKSRRSRLMRRASLLEFARLAEFGALDLVGEVLGEPMAEIAEAEPGAAEDACVGHLRIDPRQQSSRSVAAHHPLEGTPEDVAVRDDHVAKLAQIRRRKAQRSRSEAREFVVRIRMRRNAGDPVELLGRRIAARVVASSRGEISQVRVATSVAEVMGRQPTAAAC